MNEKQKMFPQTKKPYMLIKENFEMHFKGYIDLSSIYVCVLKYT